VFVSKLGYRGAGPFFYLRFVCGDESHAFFSFGATSKTGKEEKKIWILSFRLSFGIDCLKRDDRYLFT
jgi:hypothetical protein